MFRKADEDGWKAFVPVWNVIIWLKIVGRPKWWLVWFFIPVINLIIGVSITLDILKSFGKEKYWEHLAGVLLPFFYLPYVGFNGEDRYEGPWVTEGKPKSARKGELREWADAILFAGTAAMIIRTFLMEAFMIPTTSMEGSLLAGDFLFVSKFHYGVRLPMVPLSLPFIHNTIPGTNARSYIDFPTLPYNRLPGIKDVERNDIVVFNYPFNDAFPDNNQDFLVEVPSMKQNYIKRCVAVGGDTLMIMDGDVHINGKPSWEPENLQFNYWVFADPPGLNNKFLQKMGFRTNPKDGNRNFYNTGCKHADKMIYFASLNDSQLETVRTWKEVSQVLPHLQKPAQPNVIEMYDPQFGCYNRREAPLFPGHRNNGEGNKRDISLNDWNLDNFGPLYIPEKGKTIKLNKSNIKYYSRVITSYEKHDLQMNGDAIMIDGQQTDEYTFEMNYYFMMGDNRHSSLDSRYWGFVPEDHIVGRPWFVLASFEGGIRWDRILTPISKWEE